MGEYSSVIIVDDNITLLDMLSKGLSSEGYYCKTVTNAASALELINESSFDIMITDIGMPGMDGLELTKQAKRLKPDMEVIIMTGFNDKSHYNEAEQAGASDFIGKPFTLEALIARIRHVRIQKDLKENNKELRKKIKELQDFYDIAVGRELRMMELKGEIEQLKEELKNIRSDKNP